MAKEQKPKTRQKPSPPRTATEVWDRAEHKSIEELQAIQQGAWAFADRLLDEALRQGKLTQEQVDMCKARSVPIGGKKA